MEGGGAEGVKRSMEVGGVGKMEVRELRGLGRGVWEKVGVVGGGEGVRERRGRGVFGE